MIILTNSFHGTSYKFMGDEAHLDFLRAAASGMAYPEGGDAARIRRIQKRLCGSVTCRCGETSLKERK